MQKRLQIVFLISLVSLTTQRVDAGGKSSRFMSDGQDHIVADNPRAAQRAAARSDAVQARRMDSGRSSSDAVQALRMDSGRSSSDAVQALRMDAMQDVVANARGRLQEVDRTISDRKESIEESRAIAKREGALNGYTLESKPHGDMAKLYSRVANADQQMLEIADARDRDIARQNLTAAKRASGVMANIPVLERLVDRNPEWTGPLARAIRANIADTSPRADTSPSAEAAGAEDAFTRDQRMNTNMLKIRKRERKLNTDLRVKRDTLAARSAELEKQRQGIEALEKEEARLSAASDAASAEEFPVYITKLIQVQKNLAGAKDLVRVLQGNIDELNSSIWSNQGDLAELAAEKTRLQGNSSPVTLEDVEESGAE